MKGMTPQDSLGGKEKAFHDAMARDGLVSIMGTGWIKSARRRQNGRYYILIQSDEYQQNIFNDHHSVFCQKYVSEMKKHPWSTDLPPAFSQ
jgi:hypothetical protein